MGVGVDQNLAWRVLEGFVGAPAVKLTTLPEMQGLSKGGQPH